MDFGANGPAIFFLSAAILLSAIDIVFIQLTTNAREGQIDYTDCESIDSNVTCATLVTSPLNETCACEIVFYLTDRIPPPVFIYYALTNFFQNHRSIVYSKDWTQLSGNLTQPISSECKPYDEITTDTGEKRKIAPAGALANSMFFDTFALFSAFQPNHTVRIPLLARNLTWAGIRARYDNPRNDPGYPLSYKFRNFSKPMMWKKNIWELDSTDPSNNGFLNEDFIVWMQPSARPDFRKMYRRVDHSHPFYQNGLEPGKYSVKIEYAFPVAAFNGRKLLIMSNTTPFGGRNQFLTYFLMSLPALYVLAAITLLIVRIIIIKLNKKAQEKESKKLHLGTLPPALDLKPKTDKPGEKVDPLAMLEEVDETPDEDLEEELMVSFWQNLVNKEKQMIWGHLQHQPHISHVLPLHSSQGNRNISDQPEVSSEASSNETFIHVE